MNNKLCFYNIDKSIPEYYSKYNGLFVLDNENKLYIGTSDGWKELTNDIIGENISNLSDRLEAIENAPTNSSDVKKDTLKFYHQLGESNSDLKPYADSLRESMLGMSEFAKLGTGLFIHWGVYSVPAGYYDGTKQEGSTITSNIITYNAEWIMRDLSIPVDTYKAYESQFNTTNWDTDDIAKRASEAGMGYIILTIKHHEGFSLYPTKYGYWDVTTAGTDEAPCRTTIVDELKASCEKYHLKFGVYFSQYADWTAEGGFGRTSNGKWNGSTTDLFTSDQHIEYMTNTCKQIQEIVEKYNPYILWWDPVGSWASQYETMMVNDWIENYPHIITNDRIKYDRSYGDYGTGERTIYLKNKLKYGEACFTMNNTWGYSNYNEGPNDYTSTNYYYTHEKIFKQFILYTLMYGQNCLMNVGPKCDGSIPQKQLDCITAIKNFGDSYGKLKNQTRLCNKSTPNWGYMLQLDDNKIMCYVITKGNPSSQNVVLDCVPMKNLESVDILTSRDDSSYTINTDSVTITNLGLDSNTKIGVVRLNYSKEPIAIDATYLTNDRNVLNASAFPIIGTSNVSWDFINLAYKFYPYKNSTIKSEIIWNGTTDEYGITPDISTSTLDSDVYTITFKNLSNDSTQSITFTNTLESDSTIILTNGVRYQVSININGTGTSQNLSFKNITLNKHIVIVHPTGITLSSNVLSVEKEYGSQLYATITPENTTNKNVIWSSSNNNIATVDQDGYITGVEIGECVITASTEDGGLTDTCSVAVVSQEGDVVELQSISLNETSKEMVLNNTFQLVPTFTPSDSTYKSVEWISSDETKVTVSSSGLVTSVGIGSATITCKSTINETITATCIITVSGISTESVTLSNNSLTLTVGGTSSLTYTVLPDNATDKSVHWDSSDASVVSVDTEGNLQALSAGSATITITTNEGSKTDTCTVTVNAETYEYLWEKLSLDGSDGQGEIAKFQSHIMLEDLTKTSSETVTATDQYDERILLFSDKFTQWTLFSYGQDTIAKNVNEASGKTGIDKNQTLFQCVVNASTWSGIRVDGNNSITNGSVVGTHVPLRWRFNVGSDTYVNATTGEAMSNSTIEDVTSAKHPLCLSRDGNTYKWSSDGINWVNISGVNTTQQNRLRDCFAPLTVGYDYVRESNAINYNKEYRHLKTTNPCCVALKAESEYSFYTLYKKYDSSLHVPCTNIVVDTDDITLHPGDTVQLEVSIMPKLCTSTPIYASSNTNNVTVSSNGLLTYQSTGEADITITCDEQMVTIHVICESDTQTFDVETHLTNVNISPVSTEVQQGQQYIATLSTQSSDNIITGVVVLMGEVDVTETVYNDSTNIILIDSVTGDIDITASSKEKIQFVIQGDNAVKLGGIDSTSYAVSQGAVYSSEKQIDWINSILE